MILRCTQKLLKASGIAPEDVAMQPEGLLGEWYANIVPLPIRGRSVVMFTSATTLLTVVAPGRVLKTTLPVFRRRLPVLLTRLFLPPEWIAREMKAADDVRIAKTRDRQVLGCMTDLADQIRNDAYHAGEYGEEPDWNVTEIGLAQTPFSSCRYESPEARLRRLVLEAAS